MPEIIEQTSNSIFHSNECKRVKTTIGLYEILSLRPILLPHILIFF